MKRQYIYTLTILLFLTTLVVGQTTDTSSEIHLKKCTLGKTVCVLFQNDSFIVMTSISYLEKFYGNQTNSPGDIKYEATLFKECNSGSDTVNFYIYAKQKLLDHLVVNRTADLLERGVCVVKNKKTKKIVTKIEIKPYDQFDVGGKAYYVKGQLLFKTIERVY